MALIKKYYKNSTTGDILYHSYSEEIKGLQFYYINDEKGVEGEDPDLTGYVPMSEKKAEKELKYRKKQKEKEDASDSH